MRAQIFDGSTEPGGPVEDARSILVEELKQLNWEIHSAILRDEKMAYCTGCFGCWVKTPGECVINDAGRGVARAIMASDLVVYLTPVTFGGYSSELKKALDRMISMLSPHFTLIGGETHHVKRYASYPKTMALGVLPKPDAEAAGVFAQLHARNALNAYAPASAADTVVAGCEAAEIRKTIRALLAKIGVAQ